MLIDPLSDAEGAGFVELWRPRLEAADGWLAALPLGERARRSLVTWLARRLVACSGPALAEGAAPPLSGYPVAQRLCATAEAAWREACVALVERAAARRVVVGDVEVRAGYLGAGSATMIVDAGGGKRVYRDRDLRAGAWLLEVCRAANRAGLEPAFPVRELEARPDHAWDAFVAPAPCATRAEVSRYYRRAGLWLRLFEATRTTDMHALNLVAAGDAPVPIDLDGVLAARGAPPAPGLTGLLPFRLAGDDGLPPAELGGLHAGGRVVLPYELPVLRGRRYVMERDAEEVAPTYPEQGGTRVAPAGFIGEIIEGHRALDRLWAALPSAALAQAARGLAAPIFRRSGPDYRRILAASLAPALLADEQRRDAYLATRVAPDELAALRDLRIPRLSGPAAAPELRPLGDAERAAGEAAIRAAFGV